MRITTPLLTALLLTACSKDEKSVRYEVECTRCAIEYVSGDRWLESYAWGTPVLDTLFAEETPLPSDTGIISVDTIGWTATLWAYGTDERDDFSPHLKARVLSGHKAEGRIYVDGVMTASGSTDTYGEELSL